MKAEELLAKIEDKFEDGLDEFMEYGEPEASEFLLENEVEFVEDKDEDVSDSYNFTDERLQRIYTHKPSGNYFMIYGYNRSYHGTVWQGIKDVTKKEKTQTYFE